LKQTQENHHADAAHRRRQHHQQPTIVDWDAKEAATSRRGFLGAVADTGTLILPMHFPTPTTGRVRADGDRFRYDFVL